MSTGVDIPDLEFIVFLRPVKSRILFEQMLGRGTRLGEKTGRGTTDPVSATRNDDDLVVEPHPLLLQHVIAAIDAQERAVLCGRSIG